MSGWWVFINAKLHELQRSKQIIFILILRARCSLLVASCAVRKVWSDGSSGDETHQYVHTHARTHLGDANDFDVRSKWQPQHQSHGLLKDANCAVNAYKLLARAQVFCYRKTIARAVCRCVDLITKSLARLMTAISWNNNVLRDFEYNNNKYRCIKRRRCCMRARQPNNEKETKTWLAATRHQLRTWIVISH